ncbi:unnamed protein product [Medioppia subpectinata]|uniref:Chitin-binding type-2 domain-containing protein n=1 Tax=Medioppia subpectinata TaxID=1979941 RepID=A0A7R9KJC9_9ACAR|nr:unnamed protein product [Medioppia subpectinata]CAG2104335.1 unnamed protein product [Medioppia subpectinata]
MRVLCVITALLSALTLTSSQFTYIFEVQDENRGPNSELFGDLSQYKFVPPSQLPRNTAPARQPSAPQPQEPQPPVSSRRQDRFEEEPQPRRNRLSGAAQNPRQFVVRAPPQENRQALLRQELNQLPPQQLQQLQPAPLSSVQYQAQPQTAIPVAQPAPQNFPELQPHQTAHLNPVLRTIVPRQSAPAPASAPQQDPNFELLQNFVRSQAQPNPFRPNAAQTLGQSPRFNPQSQPPPQSQPRPQPQPQARQPQQQFRSGPSVQLGSTASGLPTLNINNKDSLTEDDLRAIEEHNRRVQSFLRQRQQQQQQQASHPTNRGPPQPQPQPQPQQPAPIVRRPTIDQNTLNERLAAQRAQLQEHNAQQERALREREHRERVDRERLMQLQISQMLRPETRAQVAPQLQTLPYLRPQPQQFGPEIQAGVEYAPQPNQPEERQPVERQPEVRPVPVSYNNVRVPDRRRVAPTTPAPRNYAIPRTTAEPQHKPSAESQRPATLGLAALPTDTDQDGIPGEAGRDYPTLETIPKTSFSCARQPLSGYYADTEAACQVVHLCQFGGVQDSFLCPNGTIWNQEKFSCQWWYEVSCANAPRFYALNQDLYKLPEKDDKLDDNNNRNQK